MIGLFRSIIPLLITCFISVQFCSAAIPIEPWEVRTTSIDDSVQSAVNLSKSNEFTWDISSHKPYDTAHGKVINIYRSSFNYYTNERLTVNIAPSRHPFRIYINGQIISSFGLIGTNRFGRGYKGIISHIPENLLLKGKNTILMTIFPRGRESSPPTLTLGSYEENSNREFWQTTLSYTLPTAQVINNIFIAMLFLAFFYASQWKRKDYLFFALTSLFVGLSYLNVMFASPNHPELLFNIISRSASVAASASLMTFFSFYTGVERKFRNVNRLFLSAALFFFIYVVAVGKIYNIDNIFSLATSFLIAPTMFLSLFHAVRRLKISASRCNRLIIFGIISTFFAVFHDIYFFKIHITPHFSAITYGYCFLQVAITFALAKDIWHLFIENREKAQLLEDKNLQLKQQKEKLELANTGRSRFIKNMAHEFKTPLQGIVTTVDLLNKKEKNIKTLNNIMHGLNVQMQKHLYNIQNVIDLSTIEDSNPEVNCKEFKLQNLMHDIKLLFTNNEHNRSNMFILNKGSNLPTTLIGDKDHISRISINLLTNMISDLICAEIYCTFNWLKKSDILEIRMGNATGKLHDRTREILKNPTNKKLNELSTEGSIDDLAVFVAARLLPALSAELTMNEVDGEIILHFPLKESDDKGLINSSEGKILIAEDNPVNRMLIQKILEKMGYHVLTAEDGVEAVEMTMKNHPELILMDVQMPIMDGIQATKLIRDNHKSKVIIIALTANASRSECIEAGMNDFLSKPAHMQELKTVIDQYLTA